MTMFRLFHLVVVASLIMCYLSPPCHAQSETSGLWTTEMDGWLGGLRVGASFTVKDNTRLICAHYYYARHLVNIPLSGYIGQRKITFTEPAGGVFDLHYVSDDPTSRVPLNRGNSTGLEGTWTLGTRSLHVKFDFETDYEGMPPSPRYSDVTEDSDAVFEARAQRFLKGVLSDNRLEAANAVSFPLRVNARHPYSIRTKSNLFKHWAEIFTPKYVAELRDALPHEMFVHNGLAMGAGGAVWFDAKGAAALNLP
jgi:hypothetical protein